MKKRMNMEIDEETRKQFKVECARRGLPMGKVLNDLINNWLMGSKY